MDSLQQANVVALFVQAILYGLYLVLTIVTLRWLIFDDIEWKLRGRANRIMLTTTILFFVFSTSDLFLSLRMSIVAMRGQTTAYNKYGTINNIIENATILMADAVMIYRCWVVYAYSCRAIFTPVLLWLAAVSCSVLVICSELIVGWESGFYHFWVAFYCSNILTNVYTTVAIIYRIFISAKSANHTFRQSRLYKISLILLESGSLYALTSSMNLVSSIVGGPPIIRYVSDAVNFSMTGITFNFIFIGVNQLRRGATFNGTTNNQNSIATPHLSELKFSNRTPNPSTPTATTSNEDQSRVNTPSDLECGTNGIWRDLKSTSSSNDSVMQYATPITADDSYSWIHYR